MSHFVFASAGTHGDVFPYVALASALRSRGHAVTLAANENYRDMAEQLGLDFCALVTQEETRQLLADPDVWHPVRSALVGARWATSMLPRHFNLLRSVTALPAATTEPTASAIQRPAGADRQGGEAQKAEARVLVSSPAILAARVLQEVENVPLVSVFHIPWLIKSCQRPPAMMGFGTLPAWAPRRMGALYWNAVELAARMLVGRSLNRFRQQFGLAAVKRPFDWWASPELSIGLFPGWYAQPQSDWIPQVEPCEFPVFDGLEQQPDRSVLDFCAAGRAPVVFTFGTGMQHAHRLFSSAVEACRRLKRPGLLLARDAGQIPDALPPSVRHLHYTSLRSLLPHCAAIVHHGGLGTTARALAAGIPQLIIPHAWDQLDNATRVLNLRAGGILSRRRATGGRIAIQLARLLQPDVRESCEQVAHNFGTPQQARAVRLLEEFSISRQPSAGALSDGRAD